MTSRPITHEFAGEQFRSELLAAEDARGTIIVFPTVVGISALELGFAAELNAKDLNVFVADLYGVNNRDCGREAGARHMRRIAADRAALRDRLLAVLEVVEGLGGKGAGIVVAGFCFGGLCALDLARSGAEIAGAASFHGLFDPPGLAPAPIAARVIAFHGWDDPMVPPQKVVALGQELTRGGCDWQILAFGGTRHAFTNPDADALPNPAVAFNALSNQRAWRAFDGFLYDVLG